MYLILYGVPFEILYLIVHQHEAHCRKKCLPVEMNRKQVTVRHDDY